MRVESLGLDSCHERFFFHLTGSIESAEAGWRGGRGARVGTSCNGHTPVRRDGGPSRCLEQDGCDTSAHADATHNCAASFRHYPPVLSLIGNAQGGHETNAWALTSTATAHLLEGLT